MANEQKVQLIEESLNKIAKYIDFYTFQMVRPEILNELSALYDSAHKAGTSQEQNKTIQLPANQSER